MPAIKSSKNKMTRMMATAIPTMHNAFCISGVLGVAYVGDAAIRRTLASIIRQ